MVIILSVLCTIFPLHYLKSILQLPFPSVYFMISLENNKNQSLTDNRFLILAHQHTVKMCLLLNSESLILQISVKQDKGACKTRIKKKYLIFGLNSQILDRVLHSADFEALFAAYTLCRNDFRL